MQTKRKTNRRRSASSVSNIPLRDTKKAIEEFLSEGFIEKVKGGWLILDHEAWAIHDSDLSEEKRQEIAGSLP